MPDWNLWKVASCGSTILVIKMLSLILLLHNEVVEHNEVEDDLLQVNDEQIISLNWLVIETAFKAEMHQHVIYSS
jgi:hypothetical protein